MFALSACSARQEPQPLGGQTIGLYSSLPIYWPEAGDVGDLLSADAPVHWARAELEANGTVKPIDALDSDDGKLPLDHDALLVLAQPYPLSPSENVALDDWVRAGGRVLLFADPMSTFHSTFALCDRRRPQDVALLSPILTRWGLDLQIDEDQPAGEREGEAFGIALPVNLPGSFAARESMRPCKVEAPGLGAVCEVGKGRVVAIADAALFDAEGEAGPRIAALRGLLAHTARPD
ncbi:MAG: ABC transporter [Sphingomonadaceae bacterium]